MVSLDVLSGQNKTLKIVHDPRENVYLRSTPSTPLRYKHLSGRPSDSGETYRARAGLRSVCVCASLIDVHHTYEMTTLSTNSGNANSTAISFLTHVKNVSVGNDIC